MEAVGSTRLVKEDLDRNFPETAQLSVRLHTVFFTIADGAEQNRGQGRHGL